jgi:hypothetical protein
MSTLTTAALNTGGLCAATLLLKNRINHKRKNGKTAWALNRKSTFRYFWWTFMLIMGE